ncbi:MAG: Gfo/Idh/MocA family oxidoreductase [Planctomycetota bacterium]
MNDLSKSKQGGIARRAFVKAGAGAALTAASWRRALGANERIGVGLIGYGLVGERHAIDFHQQPDVDVVAVAEAHSGRLEEAAKSLGGHVAQYGDFRKLLEDKRVDAVCISTPDHWHALMTMMACAAGKDVYVEKPLTLFVREGRWMVEVARRHRRVVQVGTQQRSGPHYQRARRFIREGRLGRIISARVDFHRNLVPGFGNPPDQEPPPELDWEMFTGPAPLRPYNPNRGIYQFRWFWDYSGGQMTNWGQHALDVVDWCLDAKGPTAVYSTGGRRFLTDNCDVPDVQETLFEYPGWSMAISIRECSIGWYTNPLGFYGTHGSLHVTRKGYDVTPDQKIPAISMMPRYEGGHPVGGLADVPKTRARPLRTEGISDKSGDPREQFKLHVRNFLDCVKSREEPLSDLESGHRVATALHLGNLSLRIGRRIRWDPEKEQILDDPEAAEMLVRPYRQPWDAELRSLDIV